MCGINKDTKIQNINRYSLEHASMQRAKGRRETVDSLLHFFLGSVCVILFYGSAIKIFTMPKRQICGEIVRTNGGVELGGGHNRRVNKMLHL